MQWLVSQLPMARFAIVTTTATTTAKFVRHGAVHPVAKKRLPRRGPVELMGKSDCENEDGDKDEDGVEDGSLSDEPVTSLSPADATIPA